MELRKTTLERRVLTGTGLQLLSRLGTASCSASALLLIGRHLGDAGLGRFNYYFNLFLVVGALVDFGSMAIAVREAARQPEREAAVIRAAFRVRVAMALSGFAVCVAVSWWKEGSLANAALPILGALHLVAVPPNAAAAWLQVRVRYAAIGLAPLIGFGVYLGLSTALCGADVHEPGWFVVAFAAALLLQSLVPWIAASRKVQLFGPVDAATVKALFTAMVPLGLSAAISTLYFRMDALLLNELHGDVANGRWAKTFPLLSFAIALPSYLAGSLFPALSRAASTPGRLVALVRRAVAVLAGFSLPALALAFAWGGQALWLFWGRRGEVEPLEQFLATNRDLLRCLPLLAFAAVAIFAAIPQMQALTALGRQSVLLRVTCAALCAKLLVGGVLIWKFGVIGAAFGTAATEWLVTIWVSVELRRASGSWSLSRALLRPVLAAAGVAAIALPLRDLAPRYVVPAALALFAIAIVAARVLPLRLGADE